MVYNWFFTNLVVQNKIVIYSLISNTITQKGLYSYLFTFCLLKNLPSRYGMFL